MKLESFEVTLMKKVLAFILILAFVMSMSTSSFAEEFSENPKISEEVEEPAEETEENEPQNSEFSEEVDGITITVNAPSGVFPSGVTLDVQKVEEKNELKKVTDEIEDLRKEENVALSYTYDIRFVDSERNEIEPTDEVLISFKSDLIEDENITTRVYHLTDTAEELVGDIEEDTFTAETDSFSYYTVEFTYNDLTYVMEGDSEIPLSKILESVGLEGEVSEVEGSNDELFSFEQKNGEWYIKANQAFTSEEWLRVTINGIEYELVVTDAVKKLSIVTRADGSLSTSNSSGPGGSATILSSNTVSQIRAVANSGYAFRGFAASPTATTYISIMAQTNTNIYSITGNPTTLYVIFAKTYTVTYNGNAPSGETASNIPSSQTKYSGETLTLSSVTPTCSGYTFVGWGTSSSATTAAYQPDDSYTSDTALSLYAIWEPEQGNAYAVLDNSGNLTFFRSSNEYTNENTGTFQDIDGNSYTGRVFSGFADSSSVPWENYKSDIITASAAQEIEPNSMDQWFYGCDNLEEAHLANIISPGSMKGTFAGCDQLEVLDIRNFETVSHMEGMLYDVASLKHICLGDNFTFNSDAMDEPQEQTLPAVNTTPEYTLTAGSMRYAVQVYGIEADEVTDTAQTYDSSTWHVTSTPQTETAGLTFGPAVGADYTQTYKSHTPTGTTASGNPHRCIHNDSWETIITCNNIDPYVYEQCIDEECTHAIELNKSATTTVMNSSFDTSLETGDGPGNLYYELAPSDIYENLRWNPATTSGNSTYGTNYGGWGATRIRAMLNGADALTDTTTAHASSASSDINKSASVYTSTNNLLAAFPAELRNAIGYRETKYDSVYNSKTDANLRTSYDRLWLLSPNEIWTTSQNTTSSYNHPLEGTQYERFSGKTTTSTSDNDATVAYCIEEGDASYSDWWWLRSSYSNNGCYALSVDSDGYVSIDRAYYRGGGVAPCFSLKKVG